MTRTSLAVFFSALLLGVFPADAGAQRTAKGQSFVEAGVGAVCTGGRRPGTEACFGRYGLDHFWRAGACICRSPLTADVQDGPAVAAGADYMHRIVSSYSRSVSVYAGGGPFVGWTGPGSGDNPTGDDGDDASREGFMYGAAARLEAELFLLPRTALTVGLGVPLVQGTGVTWTGLLLSAGIRMDLKGYKK